MINTVTKQLRKKIKNLEADNAYQQRMREGQSAELKAKKERVEELEQERNEQRHSERKYWENLEDQVIWLRHLVEDLVVSPAMVKARTTRRIRLQEAEIRFGKENEERINGGDFVSIPKYPIK